MSEQVDLLIIGGGINGVGIARDAVRRGLAVALVERDDIGSGTSSASTKLIHGGLRYLEHFEFGLVHESLRERELLLTLAPHLVHPLPFMIPVYRGGPYGRLKIGLGLMFYDLLTGRRTEMPRHVRLSAKDLRDAVPSIEPDGLLGGFLYHDAQVPYPERLCLENALDARSCGANILTRHVVTGFLHEGARVIGVRVNDLDGGTEGEIRARLTINATGPWVDAVLNLLDPRIADRMGGTRGMHVLLPRREGGPNAALYTPARTDGRPFFIVPWREYYWVGTTDIVHPDPDTAVPTQRELDYLLTELRCLLPGARYTDDDVYYAQTGVRPLPAHDFENPGAITRRHTIVDHRRRDGMCGLLSVIGGKLTTYRSLAEQVVDAAFRSWGTKPPPCQTSELGLPGAAPAERPKDADPALFNHLLSLYGRHALDVLMLATREARFAERLDPALPDIAAQVVWSVRYEMAKHLDDVLLRRTGIGTGHTEGLGCLERVADLMAEELGWSVERRSQEVARYRAFVARNHRIHEEDRRRSIS